MGTNIDTWAATWYFFAPIDKVLRIITQARHLIGRATKNLRWLPLLRDLKSLAGHIQYMFLAISTARSFLRELHSVIGDKWGEKLRMTPHLWRDMQ
jgi:hypothetical protein